jgi:hypothetical protein
MLHGNDVHNFVTKLTPTPNIRVRGVGNQLMTEKGRCTVLWKIEDDNGVVHEKLFPGTLYIPDFYCHHSRGASRNMITF